MFQFPAFAPASLVTHLQCAGLPHSEISVSKPVCSSTELIAAYHVLRRLQKPRHPPFALVTFSLYVFFDRITRTIALLHLYNTCSLLSRCLEIVVHNRYDRLSIFSRYRLISLFLLTLPRYLFSILSMNFSSLEDFRYFSNGLQRYGLFFILQIFLHFF